MFLVKRITPANWRRRIRVRMPDGGLVPSKPETICCPASCLRVADCTPPACPAAEARAAVTIAAAVTSATRIPPKRIRAGYGDPALRLLVLAELLAEHAAYLADRPALGQHSPDRYEQVSVPARRLPQLL